MVDCVRAPVAQRVGVKSGVCFPIISEGQVIGTMDFFTMETIDLSDRRRNVLRTVARAVSHAFERIRIEDASAPGRRTCGSRSRRSWRSSSRPPAVT